MPRKPADPRAEALLQPLLERSGMSPAQLAQWMLNGGLNQALETGPQPAAVVFPDPPAEPLLIRLKVQLDGAKPAIWRRLEVRGDLTMADLHDVLQAAMGWTDSHLHRFWLGPKKQIWRGPHLTNDLDDDEFGDDPGVGEEAELRIDQILRSPKDRLFYTYDFGDSWQHTITVENVRTATEDDPRARCLAGKNACPLEDCGGVGGHEEILELLRTDSTRRSWREELVNWVPPQWDPLTFDVDEANQAINLIDSHPLAALGVPELHPALDDLIDRLDSGDVDSFTGLLVLALDPTVREVSDEQVRDAVRPWQLFLTLAGEDGIPLTSAGWMRPAVVEQIARELGVDQWWIGKTNREDLTAPVARLREHVMELGLLRKFKGNLVRTPRGRAIDGHPDYLWELLADSLLTTGRDGDAGARFEQNAAVASLVHIAAGHPIGQETNAAVATLLTRSGWSINGGPIDRHEIPYLGWTADVIAWVGPVERPRGLRSTPPTAAQRALAATALIVD